MDDNRYKINTMKWAAGELLKLYGKDNDIDTHNQNEDGNNDRLRDNRERRRFRAIREECVATRRERAAKTNTEDDLPQHNPQSYNGPQKWPPALSCLWALRRVFICMAITGATCRALLLILRVWIPDVEAAPIAVELTLLVLQIFWVKRPSPPETGTELPTEVMHGGPGGILPRFGVFAVTTAVLELVSVAISSQVSLSQACGFLPVALNILAAPVTVARCYSAFLALKLQDEADKLARRIAPEDLSSTPLDANLGDICIDLSESPAAAKHTSPTKLLKESSPEKKKIRKGAF